MTMILILNALSSLLAAVGVIEFGRRRARRRAVLAPVYATVRRPR